MQDLFGKFPSSLGLIILLACLDAPVEELKQLVGVEKGADIMEDTFRQLGYAILRLPIKTTSLQLKAVMKAASKASYPESYKRIFFYFTGHGTDNAIYTPDADVSHNEIVQYFQCDSVRDIPKVFIFDCCRDKTPTHPTCAAVNTMIIYSTIPGGQAYAPYDESGVMTAKLAKLLLTQRKSITDIVAKLSQEVQDLQMHPVVLCQLQQSISLLKERDDASMCVLLVYEFKGTPIEKSAVFFPPNCTLIVARGHWKLHISTKLLWYIRVKFHPIKLMSDRVLVYTMFSLEY